MKKGKSQAQLEKKYSLAEAVELLIEEGIGSQGDNDGKQTGRVPEEIDFESWLRKAPNLKGLFAKCGRGETWHFEIPLMVSLELVDWLRLSSRAIEHGESLDKAFQRAFEAHIAQQGFFDALYNLD